MNIKLKIADYVSLLALFFAFISIILILKKESYWSLILIMFAFAFDILDGYLARKIAREDRFGRELDSYVDIFTYLIFSTLFFYEFISPHIFVSILIGFCILTFGGLRLIRFNLEGIREEHDRKYYRGLTVVHILFLTILTFFLQKSLFWNSWYTTVLLFLASPLMISDYKSYKIENFWFFALIIFGVIGASLFFLYGGY